MPRFSKEDFHNREHATRLTVVIMKLMDKKPLTQFRDLPPTQQTKFNRFLNEYIQSLGEEWELQLFNDFDRIVNEDILNEEFDPSTIFVRDTTVERNVLLTEEQQEWIKTETELIGEAPRY